MVRSCSKCGSRLPPFTGWADCRMCRRPFCQEHLFHVGSSLRTGTLFDSPDPFEHCEVCALEHVGEVARSASHRRFRAVAREDVRMGREEAAFVFATFADTVDDLVVEADSVSVSLSPLSRDSGGVADRTLAKVESRVAAAAPGCEAVSVERFGKLVERLRARTVADTGVQSTGVSSSRR